MSSISSNIFPPDFPYEDFDKGFTDLVHNLPGGFFEYLKSKLMASKAIFQKTTTHLELVLDTNVAFSQVRTMVLKKDCLLMKLVDKPFLKLIAPSTLRDELHEKIRLKFPKDKQTRDIDIEACIKQADKLLDKVTIHDVICENAQRRASEYLNERDSKDVPFLALGLSMNTHGIMTNDKDFSVQGEVKSWDLKESGKVVSDLSKGSFVFFLFQATTELLFELLVRIISAIWGALISIVIGLSTLFLELLAGSFIALFDLPRPLLAIVGVAFIAIMLNPEARKASGEVFREIWEGIKEFVQYIRDFLLSIWQMFKELWELIKPFVMLSLGILAYLLENSQLAINKLDELEKSRPSNKDNISEE